MYPWLTGSYSLSDDSLYMYIIVHISCVIIPVYFNHMFPFWLDHIVNTYVHYLLMSPDICYLMYTLSLICPSPHRRMISPLCSTFQYYPTTNNIYLAASICMQKISLQILVYFVSLPISTEDQLSYGWFWVLSNCSVLKCRLWYRTKVRLIPCQSS